MKLTWHIITKDLRSQAWAMAIWITLLVAKVAVSAAAFAQAGEDGASFEQLGLSYDLLAILETVFCFLLAAAIVLEDALVGPSVFWVTRPISGRRLLAAKLSSLFLLLVCVPILVWLPWWLLCGYGPDEVARSAGYVALAQVATILPALLMGVLVGRSSRFMQVLMVVLVLLLIAFAKSAVSARGVAEASPALAETRQWLGGLAAMLTVAAVVWGQYTRRRLHQSALVAIAGLAAAFAVGTEWPWASSSSWQAAAPTGAEKAVVSLEYVRLAPARYRKPPEGVRSLELAWLVSDISPTLRLQGGEVEFKLRWKDGSSSTHGMRVMNIPNWDLPRETAGAGPYVVTTDSETQAYIQTRRATPTNRLPWSIRNSGLVQREIRRRDQSLVGEIWLDEKLAKRLEEERPACEGWLKVDLLQPQVRVRTRLPAEDTLVGRGLRLRVVMDRPTEISPAGSIGRSTEGEKPQPVRERVVGLGIVVARPTYGSMPIVTVIQPATGLISYPVLPRSAGPFGSKGEGFSMFGVHYSAPLVRRGDRWEPAPGSDQPFELVAYTFEDAGEMVRSWQAAELPWTQGN